MGEKRERELDLENQKLFETAMVQDKALNMMAKLLSKKDVDKEICEKAETCYYDLTLDKKHCKNCIKEIFLKEAVKYDNC